MTQAPDVRHYAGDGAHACNDEAPTPDANPEGPFYELESRSSAVALALGATLTHTATTPHLTSPEKDLDVAARYVLGVSLAEIESALTRP